MKDIEASMKSSNTKGISYHLFINIKIYLLFFYIKVNFLIVKSLLSLARQLIIHSKQYIKRKYFDVKAKELFDWVLIDNSKPAPSSFDQLSFSSDDIQVSPINNYIESIYQLCKHQSVRIDDMINYLQKEISNNIDSDVPSHCIYLMPMIQSYKMKEYENKSIENIIQYYKIQNKDVNKLNIMIYKHMKNLYNDQSTSFYHIIKKSSDYFEHRIKDEIRMEEQGFYILERFKNDIDNFASIACKSITFTFPNIRQYDEIMGIFQYMIVDFILYEIYHTLIVVFKMLNKDKDSKLLSKRIFYERNTDKEAFGLSNEAWTLFNREDYQRQCNLYLDIFMEKKSKFKKLLALETFYQYVMDSLLKEKKKTVGADDLLPLLCHTLSLSRGKLFTHLSFLHTFGNENDLFGKHGYILVSLESALNIDLNKHNPQVSST